MEIALTIILLASWIAFLFLHLSYVKQYNINVFKINYYEETIRNKSSLFSTEEYQKIQRVMNISTYSELLKYLKENA